MSDIQKLERSIADAKELSERANMARRLAQNPDFKKLFLEMYFVSEPARLIGLATDRVNCSPEIRADSLEMAKATAHCKRYLQFIVTMGERLGSEIPAMEEALAEARSEDKEA